MEDLGEEIDLVGMIKLDLDFNLKFSQWILIGKYRVSCAFVASLFFSRETQEQTSPYRNYFLSLMERLCQMDPALK